MRSSSYFLSVEIDTTIISSLRCQLQVELHSYHLLEFVMPPVIIWCCESTSVSWFHLVLQVSFEKLAVLICLYRLDTHRSIAEYQYILPHLVIDEVPLVKIVSQEGTWHVPTSICRVLNFAVISNCINWCGEVDGLIRDILWLVLSLTMTIVGLVNIERL